MSITKKILATGALCLASLAAAPSAFAGEVALESGQLVYRASDGEASYITVTGWDGTVVMIGDNERPTVAAGTPCEATNATPDHMVECVPQAGGLRVEAGDRDDDVRVGNRLGATGRVSVDGGAGNDKLVGPGTPENVDVALSGGDGADDVSGGDGNDLLDGGPGNDRLDGDEGDDRLLGGDGDDVVIGEEGADTIDGGPGFDKSENDWTGADRITVTLDGAADDGAPGEGDNVVSVEHVYTFVAATLVAAGDPVRFEVIQGEGAPTRLVGSPGGDHLRAYDLGDAIDGGGGNDTIEGGNGDDTIDPGPGEDTVNAEAGSGSCNFLVCRGAYGNDTIQARDGERDSIECGVGEDRVTADAVDVVAASCETVDRPVGPDQPDDGGNVGDDGGGSDQAQPACVVPRVKRGARVAATRSRLQSAGCRIKVKRVRARGVRRGRVVGLALRSGRRLKVLRAGRRLPGGVTVVVKVSRGRR